MGLIAAAEIALILFAVIPPPYNAFALLLNGLPLGMIWGFVFSYLEGRKTSELLGSGMAVSFIVSSGLVKTVGQVILDAGCGLFWMPAATGAIFFLPLGLSVFCLESFPEPTEDDVAARTERIQMNSESRIQFFKDFGPALILMTLFYTLLSAYRDFRDNFAAELWEAFGESGTPSVFTTSEIIVAVIIVIPIGLFMMIKDYMTTLVAYHVLIACGLVMTLICTIVLDTKGVPGLPYMVSTGVGLYMGYVPFNSIIFDLSLWY
jgi:hypothetical protein